MIEVYDALGKAYGLAILSNDRPAAVALLRETIVDDDKKAAAVDIRRNLESVVRARSQGNRCGCFVSKTAFDLLTDALEQGG